MAYKFQARIKCRKGSQFFFHVVTKGGEELLKIGFKGKGVFQDWAVELLGINEEVSCRVSCTGKPKTVWLDYLGETHTVDHATEVSWSVWIDRRLTCVKGKVAPDAKVSLSCVGSMPQTSLSALPSTS